MIKSPGYSTPRALTDAEKVALKGKDGANGVNGRGIASSAINGAKHLILTYTDGTTADVGVVVGNDGANGTNGSNGIAGRGITSSAVNGSGRLILTYSDGTTQDAGYVVGSAGSSGTNGSNGRGITSATVNGSGRLILTLTDGTTQDAGYVIGATGAAGQNATTAQIASAVATYIAANPLGTLLGTFILTETAVVAINAGTRRLTVTVPSGWGVTTGQNLIAFPVSVPTTAYATHDVIATAANTISVGLTTPLIALLASYSITCRLVRINT